MWLDCQDLRGLTWGFSRRGLKGPHQRQGRNCRSPGSWSPAWPAHSSAFPIQGRHLVSESGFAAWRMALRRGGTGVGMGEVGVQRGLDCLVLFSAPTEPPFLVPQSSCFLFFHPPLPSVPLRRRSLQPTEQHLHLRVSEAAGV